MFNLCLIFEMIGSLLTGSVVRKRIVYVVIDVTEGELGMERRDDQTKKKY